MESNTIKSSAIKERLGSDCCKSASFFKLNALESGAFAERSACNACNALTENELAYCFSEVCSTVAAKGSNSSAFYDNGNVLGLIERIGSVKIRLNRESKRNSIT